MPISLIVGPPNSGRAPEIRRRLETALGRDPVLVVPTGDDAARFERELCRERGATLGVSIRTFASLFDHVAQATGVRPRTPLSGPQRLALVRAAVRATPLRILARSAARAGFAPALDALIVELQAALVTPGELDAAARDLDDGEYERELAALYAGYVELRERAERSDPGSRAAAVLDAVRFSAEAWGNRPLFVYGFDDLTRAQVEVLAALSRATEVLVAVNYGDRDALQALAPLLARLQHELGAEIVDRLDHDPTYTERESLRHLDRLVFEPGAPAVQPDDGVLLLECAGELGEAEAIAGEIARLLADGVAAEEIAVVARDVSRRGPIIGRVLDRFGIPAAVEASVPLDRTAVGRALVALCRAASPDGEASDLLAHLRADPSISAGTRQAIGGPRPSSRQGAVAAGPVDWLERRIRRERPASVDDAVSSWEKPPRHLAAVRAANGPAEQMRALAAAAGELAEAVHSGTAPVSAADGVAAPFEPLELRAAAIARELLGELAEIGELPGCRPPDLAEAAEAIEGAQVPLWRGPSDGRVRVLDPYRMRAGRARHLFCVALQEGEFPRRGGQDPLLSDERRSRLGLPALLRHDPQDEERYLFHACVSRPTDRLCLSWQGCDDEGAPLPRSPFVDEVLDLLACDTEAAVKLPKRRGLERVTFEPAEAPSERELARSLAKRGRRADHAGALAALGVEDASARRILAALGEIPESGPRSRPGPLRVEAVLADLRDRHLLSASSLEGWLECSYRWFVAHELQPQRLDPEPDPLRIGTVAHRALQALYADPPGEDSIPRVGDVGRWKSRLAELVDEIASEQGLRPQQPPDSVTLARLRAQVEAFLEEEAELDTKMRPRADLLEAAFGFGDDGPDALELGEVGLRGQIDRIDVGPDGRTALVRDYKTSKGMPGRRSWEKEGKLQLQLYVLAARERLGLEPIGGLYHPLGGRDDRRPRGMVIRDDARFGELSLVGGDPCDADDFNAELDRARAQATANAEAMRSGAIDRDPIGGRCPSYCAYQPICRIERAVGLEDEGANGSRES